MGYKISHNTTGSVLVNQTNYTAFVVESATPGMYLFTVLAVNTMGDGTHENVIIKLAGCQECLISCVNTVGLKYKQYFYCTAYYQCAYNTHHAASPTFFNVVL